MDNMAKTFIQSIQTIRLDILLDDPILLFSCKISKKNIYTKFLTYKLVNSLNIDYLCKNIRLKI